ncbi:MAG: asparaginase, partial [Candidatus Marinimicrobia bacterium]|nr:asparaginase [Candidatus Neomarinimicrobiota bacterium]
MILVSKQYMGDIVESFHIGYAAAVDEKGDIIFSAGEPEYPIFIHSAAKPFQVVALLESGAVDKFNLTDEEIA